MKTAVKRGNDKLSAMTLKPVSGPISLGNRPTSAKLWAITHENGPKKRKRQVLAMTLKPFSGLTGLVNRPRSPKLWAIAHEKGLKTRKRQVFSHDSQNLYRVK